MASSEDPALNQAVENLSVSGETKKHADEDKGKPSGARRERQGGVNDSGEWQEPRTRNDHDNRFSLPNRTFSRDNRGRGDRDNRSRDYQQRGDRVDRGGDRGDRGGDRSNRDNWTRDGDRGNRGGRGDRGFNNDDRRERPREAREERPQAKPLTESDKNYQEQQRARAEQRRIKTQMMLERQKEYLAKQKSGGDGVVEKENPDGEEEDEIKDEGDVWGHDGWDDIIHSSNPKRRYRQERPNEPRKEEASIYVNPHLRSTPKQEEWQKDQVNKLQVRAQEQEHKKADDEEKAKARAEKKQFIRPLYVPPGRKAVQAQQEAEKSKETQQPEEKKEEEIVDRAKGNGSRKEDDGEDYDEEVDDYDEDEDGEDNEDGEGGASGVVLIMQVEISPGVSKSLQVRRGDLPKEIATRFCTEHGMNVKFIKILTENIQRHLEAQPEEPNT